MPDDHDLLDRIGRGDEAAFRTLIERHGRYLYGVAHALTGHASDAEDVVQETLTAAVKGRFRGDASVRTWLVQILVRQAAMIRRWRSRHPVHPLENAEIDRGGGGTDRLGSTRGTDARLDLSTMLDSLSPEHRAVIVLRELEGLSYEQIAAVLHVPRGTVESRLHRAREQMQQLFKGYF